MSILRSTSWWSEELSVIVGGIVGIWACAKESRERRHPERRKELQVSCSPILPTPIKRRKVHTLQILIIYDQTDRDGFREMIDSVAAKNTFDETREYLKNSTSSSRIYSQLARVNAYKLMFGTEIKLDSGFKVFFEWCKAHDVPVVIVSSGMAPIIRGEPGVFPLTI